MLGKLIKHEFRATGRVTLPIFGLVLLLSLFMAGAIRIWDGVQSGVLNALLVLLMVAWIFAQIGVFIVVLAQMVSRFRNNYLRDEGYVMHTLPLTTHHLVWAKAIVASVWFMATVVVVCLAAVIVGMIGAYTPGMFQEIMRVFADVWSHLTAYYAINGITIFLEGVLVCFASFISFCVMCYASLALGHGFDRRKMLLSVVFFFVFYSVVQTLGTVVLASGGMDGMVTTLSAMDPMAAIHTVMLVTLGIEVATGAIFYFITTHCLKNRLNLE